MREERAKDAVESGGKALCVGGVEAEGVDGFIGGQDANSSSWELLQTLIHHNTMSLTTAIIRQSSRLACTALCRRRLFAHSLQFDKVPQRRTFVSTRPHRAAPAPTPTATPAVLRRSPTREDIENAELDMEPLAQTDARLALTERAAEVHRYSTPTY